MVCVVCVRPVVCDNGGVGCAVCVVVVRMLELTQEKNQELGESVGILCDVMKRAGMELECGAVTEATVRVLPHLFEKNSPDQV